MGSDFGNPRILRNVIRVGSKIVKFHLASPSELCETLTWQTRSSQMFSTRTFFSRQTTSFLPTRIVGWTYDDLSLCTLYSDILPRETQLETRLAEGIELHLPILSSDMDTVTESRMAIAMAQHGGMGLIHYNMTARDQLKEVSRVKNHVHGLITDPITVRPESLIGEVLELIERKGFTFSTFPWWMPVKN